MHEKKSYSLPGVTKLFGRDNGLGMERRGEGRQVMRRMVKKYFWNHTEHGSTKVSALIFDSLCV